MNAYAMFRRCWDHQPDPCLASHDPNLWALLVAEGLISQESQTWCISHEFTEQGGMYPGAYRLDEVIPGSGGDGP